MKSKSSSAQAAPLPDLHFQLTPAHCRVAWTLLGRETTLSRSLEQSTQLVQWAWRLARLLPLIAFAPSFVFVLAGGRHFEAFRRNATAKAFLGGAGPAAIGAIGGAAITLGLGLTQLWQVGVLVAAGLWLLLLRRGVVAAILAAAAIGIIVALAGGPV